MLPEEPWGQEQWCLKSGPQTSNIGVPCKHVRNANSQNTQDLLNPILSIWGPTSVLYQTLLGTSKYNKGQEALSKDRHVIKGFWYSMRNAMISLKLPQAYRPQGNVENFSKCSAEYILLPCLVDWCMNQPVETKQCWDDGTSLIPRIWDGLDSLLRSRHSCWYPSKTQCLEHCIIFYPGSLVFYCMTWTRL